MLGCMVTMAIEFEQELDGRWIAEIAELPGVLAYGETKAEACARVEALALRVLADRIELRELELDGVSFQAA